MRESFKKLYRDKLYDEIEQKSGLVGKRVELKNNSIGGGNIIGLWLPADSESKRKFDLWYVAWDNGNFGIVEENDINLI